jgi:hypothetical protein
VKTGKNGAFGGVSKLNALILALGALCLAGCATEVSRSAAPVPSRIVLEPSDESYKDALLALTPTEQKILKKGMSFTIDTLLAAPTPIETMTWSRKRPDTPLWVNISDFVRYMDLQPALAGGTRVNVVTARVLAGLTYDQATFDPVFRIQAEIEPPNANVTTVTALGMGPACKRPADEFPLDSAKLTQSEEIAFMKAFLKTLLKINDQLQQEG